MATEQILGLLAVILLSETILPYGQMVISYEAPEGSEDLWIWDFMRALLRFSLSEVVAKVAAYAVAVTLLPMRPVGSVLIVMAVAAGNSFYLARRKLDRFYSA